MICRYAAADELLRAGVPVTLILDSAVGYIMEKVDLVLVGAEGVVENGGIINKVANITTPSFPSTTFENNNKTECLVIFDAKVGTYQIAIVAKALKRPVHSLLFSFAVDKLHSVASIDS